MIRIIILVIILSPLFLVSQWSEPKTLTKHVKVAISMPSAVQKGGFAVRVLPGGCSLKLAESFPGQIADIKALHKTSLFNSSMKYEMYHKELARFCESQKRHRLEASDWITSEAVESRQCRVQAHNYLKHTFLAGGTMRHVLFLVHARKL